MGRGQADVIPRKDVFLALRQERTLKEVLQALDQKSKSVYTRYLCKGRAVSEQTMLKFARILKRPVSDLIVVPQDKMLATTPRFYRLLRHGYFVDVDWLDTGQVNWWHESIRLYSATTVGSKLSGHAFVGTLKNQFGDEFQVEARLIGKLMFTMVATCKSTRSDVVIAFQSTFRRQTGEVLCGIWHGMDPFQRKMCVYRMYLSTKELSHKTILQLAREVPIMHELDRIDTFGFPNPESDGSLGVECEQPVVRVRHAT